MTFCELIIYNDNPYWSDFVPNSTFYRLLSDFHRTFATGVACRQGTLTPPDTWSRPFGTFICSTCWDQSFSELVVIFRTKLFEYPSEFLDFTSTSHTDTWMTYCQSITQTLRINWVKCISLSLRSKTRRRATPLRPTLIYSCRSRVTSAALFPLPQTWRFQLLYHKLSVP